MSQAVFLGSPPRGIAVIVAIGCLGVACTIAWHHPLAPALALAALLLWTAAVLLRSVLWLFVVPALLPIIDLAPWTGWLVAEEFDILVLGAAAGAYLSMALRGDAGRFMLRVPRVPVAAAVSSSALRELPQEPQAQLSRLSVMLIGLFGLWTFFSLCRGINAAGAMQFDWFDGYYTAANSLRVAKSYLLAVLMLPPLLVELRRSDRRAVGALAAGLVTGLGFASLAILWERLAFPGLLNFSSDYRTTAMFWEMHVGGAALDGFLVLTVPFAVREILAAPHWSRWPLAAATLLLAAYACLTTFSRGVFLAVPVSVALLAVLLLMKGNLRSVPSAAGAMIKGCAMVLVMAALSHLVFRAGGYRSLLAVLGVLALTMPLGTIARNLPARGWVAALALGLLAGFAGSAGALLVFKGIYANYALAFACCALLVAYGQRSDAKAVAIAALGAYVWLIIASAGVALGWGGAGAFRDSTIVLAALMAWTLCNARARSPLPPRGARMQGAVLGMATLAAVAAAVFSAGAYVTDRFASTERDLAGRMQHWRDGVGLLTGPEDWLLGKGAGRFPQYYLFSVGDREFPGSSSIGSLHGGNYLVLSGPRHEVGFGEMFRVAQRVPIAPGDQFSIVLEARSLVASRLHLEVCERQLLYVEGCAIAALDLPPSGESWRRYVVALNGAKLGGGPWYAPRPVFFAIAAENPETRVDIDQVSLIEPGGQDLLANGTFTQGMARWFTTSDRFHLPWHIKNLGLNLLFDQGVLGLLLFTMLVGGAWYRLVAGSARRNPFAPFLAAALAGFLLVGLFDSLLDVPRVAFLFYLLILASLALPKYAAAPHA